MKRDYFEGADVAVTICAKDGTILDMNQKSRRTFLKPGREEIIGQNVLDCHPEPARSMLADMLENPRTNVYTVEKEGVKKLIFQCPWYDEDEYAGYMELSMVQESSKNLQIYYTSGKSARRGAPNAYTQNRGNPYH